MNIFTKNDCSSLKIIYQKMGGDVKSIPKNCCKMSGVTCSNGHVTKISWSNQGLTGSIPLELGKLLKLQEL